MTILFSDHVFSLTAFYKKHFRVRFFKIDPGSFQNRPLPPVAPLPPVSYATYQVHFKHEQPQVLSPDSLVAIRTVQQMQDVASALCV